MCHGNSVYLVFEYVDHDLADLLDNMLQKGQHFTISGLSLYCFAISIRISTFLSFGAAKEWEFEIVRCRLKCISPSLLLLSILCCRSEVFGQATSRSR